MQALVSVGMTSDISRCLPLVLELSDFFQHCELSYIGLVTGCEVDMISKLVLGGKFYCLYVKSHLKVVCLYNWWRNLYASLLKRTFNYSPFDLKFTDDCEVGMDCFSQVKLGAALAGW